MTKIKEEWLAIFNEAIPDLSLYVPKYHRFNPYFIDCKNSRASYLTVEADVLICNVIVGGKYSVSFDIAAREVNIEDIRKAFSEALVKKANNYIKIAAEFSLILKEIQEVFNNDRKN